MSGISIRLSAAREYLSKLTNTMVALVQYHKGKGTPLDKINLYTEGFRAEMARVHEDIERLEADQPMKEIAVLLRDGIAKTFNSDMEVHIITRKRKDEYGSSNNQESPQACQAGKGSTAHCFHPEAQRKGR